jgi:hypothetical protein
MKLREINEAPVNEEGIIGRGIAAAQQLGSKLTGGNLSQLSVTDRHAMNIFIKDFLKKVSPALGIAINSKIVDPTIVDTSSTGGGGAIRPTGAPISQLGQQTRQQMLAQRAANAAPGAGRRPSAPVQSAPAAPTTRQPPEPELAPFDFNPPEEIFNVGRREPKVGSLSEAQYQKLNSIFESILLNEAKSIPTFLKDFLHANVPQLNTNDPEIAKVVNQLISQVQADWTKDKGKSALTKLAQSAYILAMLPSSSGALSAAGTAGTAGAGGQGGRTQGAGVQGGGAGGAQAAPEIAQYTNNILSQINRMQRNDADDLDAIIMNSLRRLYKVNSSAYMDTVNHLKTMLQSSAPKTPAPGQAAPAAPNLVIARESKSRVRK